MPAKPTLHNVISDATRAGVSTNRFRISKEDADRIKAAEKLGHNEAVKLVLQILFRKPA